MWSATTEEKFILTDAHNTLNTWQEREALDHWKRELHSFSMAYL